MGFGLALLLVGGFLLGGVYSVWKADPDRGGRSTGQVFVAVVLLIAAGLATAAGILRLV
ncbi:hypothetical protein [Trujillonella humicola]|uniref:hypothetical protein n=1 Tax=Trujillonella humicola TaxID=3383699 RepID=UPI0039060C53